MFIIGKAGNGGGVVITFNEEISFSSIIIGARKTTASWNHGRYQGVKVLVDGQEVAKTSSSFRVPDDYVISIGIPGVKGTSLELKWPPVPVQIATLEVLYTKKEIESWKAGDPAADMVINGGNWPGFKMSDLDNNPDTMWISGINKQIKSCLTTRQRKIVEHSKIFKL